MIKYRSGNLSPIKLMAKLPVTTTGWVLFTFIKSTNFTIFCISKRKWGCVTAKEFVSFLLQSLSSLATIFKIRSLPFSPYLSLWYSSQSAHVPGNWHKLWQPTLTLTWSMHTSFYSSLSKSGHLYLKSFTAYTLFFYSEFLFYFFTDTIQGHVYFGFQISVIMTGETDLTRKKN